MTNDRRKNHNDGNGARQQGSSRIKSSPELTMSFSFRTNNEAEEYSNSDPEGSSRSNSRELGGSNHRGSKSSTSRRKSHGSGERPRSNRSSTSSDRSHMEYDGTEQRCFRPSKAMRRNSATNGFGNSQRRSSSDQSFSEENPASHQHTDRTDRTTSLSYIGSEHSNPMSYVSHKSSDHSKPRSYTSQDRNNSRSRKNTEHRRKAGRRNSCDFNSQSSRPSGGGGGGGKARRRNSCDYDYQSSRPSGGGGGKARRRNSCDYDYQSSRPSTNDNAKTIGRNSWADGFAEDFSISYMSTDGEPDLLQPDQREYPENEYKSSKVSSSSAAKTSRSDKEHKSSRLSACSTSKNSHRNSSDKERRSSRLSSSSAVKSSRRNSSDKERRSSRPSGKTSRRNSAEYEHESSRPSASSGEIARSNSWNDSHAEEHHRKSKAAKQRKPRRMKSNPNPVNSKPKHEMKMKKKAGPSTKHQSNNTQNETQKSPPKSIRLNSQLMKKVGDFRPYFVPLRRKQEVLTSGSEHEPHMSKTFTLSLSQTLAQEIESFRVNDGPAKLLYEAMKNISVASFLREGVPIVKVSHSKLGKLRRRVLTLSDDQTTLFLTHSKLAKGTKNMIPKQPAWTPSKGWNGTYIRSVDIANICDFQAGVISSRWLELSTASHAKRAKKQGGENPPTENGGSTDFLPFMPDPARVASAISIFHIDATTGRMDSLDFFVENPDHRRAVVATLALMKYTYEEVSQLVGNEILLYRYVLKDMNLGTNDNGLTEMNENEFLGLSRHLNFTAENIGQEYREFFQQHSEKYDNGKNKNKLPIHECLQLVQLLKGKENPYAGAWRACFGTATCVNALTVLTKFLHGPQQEQLSSDIQDARDLVNVMNATELGEVLSNRKGSLLTQWQFEEFLRSEWNDIYDPEKRVIDKERKLGKPLSHYWINSSFRTSSMSDGVPSIQSYTEALLRGCKSLDLNCWDGIILPSGECVPIIVPTDENPKTSFTMKNKLIFRTVVLVVRKYLRDNRTTYPIILNLENNCSQPFQKSMFESLKSLFGKHLFIPTENGRRKELPTPEDLRGMIVVNMRRPPQRIDGPDSYRSKSMTGVSDAYLKMFNKFNTVKTDSFSSPIPDLIPRSLSSRNVKTSDKNIGNELISLSLFHEVKFSGYFLESMDLICSQMHGIKNTLVPKIVKEYSDNPELWRKYNESHLTRIYPSTGDKDSTDKSTRNPNYNPVLARSMGCQMTSLNFQNNDTELAVNDGFFRQTGGIGYVEKPQWLLGIGGRPKPMSFKIRLLSGSCIPKTPVGDKEGPTIEEASIDSPRVFLELHDVVTRKSHVERFKISKHKVECGNKNGFFPIFEDKGRKFNVETPDVAMLVFRVEQSNDEGKVLSTTAIPVSCLRKGYRSVQLYDADNTRYGRFASATLLVFLM